MKLISIDAATNHQIQTLSRYMGLDQLSERAFNAICDDKLKRTDRIYLVNIIKEKNVFTIGIEGDKIKQWKWS